MPKTHRRIGRIGTASRVLVGLALLYLALADGGSWGLPWHEALLGLVVFPAVMVALGLGARLLGVGPVRFNGPVGIAANTAVVVALVLSDYTAGAAALFYGVTLLVAAWRAQPGCEATVLSNWILGRDDQIGCPTFTPIDEAEARLATRNRDSTQTRAEPVAAEHAQDRRRRPPRGRLPRLLLRSRRGDGGRDRARRTAHLMIRTMGGLTDNGVVR